MFAFGSLYLSTFFISCFIIIAHFHVCQILFMCSHQYSTKRVIEARQLIIQRNHEKKFQSPSRGIQTHSWLYIVCQYESFNFTLFAFDQHYTYSPPSRCIFFIFVTRLHAMDTLVPANCYKVGAIGPLYSKMSLNSARRALNAKQQEGSQNEI